MGAGLIRVELATQFPGQTLPHEATLRRWFRDAGLTPPPPPPRPPTQPRATVPHERWQRDATEQIRLADGSRVSWLAASDEASGGMLGAVVFPLRRLDAGSGGSFSAFPPDLALWLLGLGIALVWNRPRHEQGNAVIERAHGVCQRWVEAHPCDRAEDLQARLDYLTALQRARYPACQGQHRLAASPALATGGRPYDPAQDDRQGDERRVWTWLAARAFTRRVDQVGRISLANRALGVGRAWTGQTVTARLAIVDGVPIWHIRDERGTLLRTHPAPELSRERILALAVSHRPDPGQPPAHSEGQPYTR